MNGRALLAAGVFLALLIAAVLITRPKPPLQEERPAQVRQPAPPVIAAPKPTLTRADLIDIAASAADAHVRGAPMPAEVSDIAERRFSIRLPFGCDGPSATDSEAPMRWSYDAEQETLRVSVAPNVWTDAEPVRAAAGEVDYEAAEGFWLGRPWLRSGDCPAPAQTQPAAEVATSEEASNSAVADADTEQAAASVPEASQLPVQARQTIALVELFKADTPRAARRNGKPYVAVVKIAPNEIDLSKGLRLVVTGRVVPLGSGATVVCSGDGLYERPLCLVGAEIERVTITDASGQRTLGEWGF